MPPTAKQYMEAVAARLLIRNLHLALASLLPRLTNYVHRQALPFHMPWRIWLSFDMVRGFHSHACLQPAPDPPKPWCPPDQGYAEAVSVSSWLLCCLCHDLHTPVPAMAALCL